ncbi:MAG: hypothetical protein KDK97_20215 [Verrucomicrobiales bacterium]|nr:hypothetical protein [Verrucomicrobiales bacterium]
MPHIYQNWRDEDNRRFILNEIAWTAKLEVPPESVETALPDLATLQPASADSTPRPPKPKNTSAQPK